MAGVVGPHLRGVLRDFPWWEMVASRGGGGVLCVRWGATQAQGEGEGGGTCMWGERGETLASMRVLASRPRLGDSRCVSFELRNGTCACRPPPTHTHTRDHTPVPTHARARYTNDGVRRPKPP